MAVIQESYYNEYQRTLSDFYKFFGETVIYHVSHLGEKRITVLAANRTIADKFQANENNDDWLHFIQSVFLHHIANMTTAEVKELGFDGEEYQQAKLDAAAGLNI